MKQDEKQDEKQAANWFHWIGLSGLLLSVGVFVLYVTALIPSGVQPSESGAHWRESSEVYLEKTGLVFDSGWIGKLADGYFMSTSALALLASAALPTLLVLSVIWIRRKDYIYGIMALLICAVLLTAILG